MTASINSLRHVCHVPSANSKYSWVYKQIYSIFPNVIAVTEM